MRKVWTFLVWLFSFWTWKDFSVRWLWNIRASHPSSGDSVENLPSRGGQHESEFARFLSSLPEGERTCVWLYFYGRWEVRIEFGNFRFQCSGMEAVYAEFLEAVASSEILFQEEVEISVRGNDSCKDVDEFAAAFQRSGNGGFRILYFNCLEGSPIQMAKCIASVLLKNGAIQDLHLHVWSLKHKMGKELVAEFMSTITMPHNLRILKSFRMRDSIFDIEGMEQLMKSLQGPLNVLEKFVFNSLTSDAQLQHISGMLASSTSLKTLEVFLHDSSLGAKKAFPRGYTNLAMALCSNQSLKALHCEISSSIELKVLLDPLISKNKNGLQCNTTLMELRLFGSIGGKEGTEALVDMIHTNMSLLKLGLMEIVDLSMDDKQGVENLLAILEALKANKSLKTIDFWRCEAVGGYKVLGAIMDLILENHCIESIDLDGTPLEDSGDADYIYFSLSKRRKMKLWDIIQNMAIAKPTSGRVFLCGQPLAGKTQLRTSMKDLKEFQRKAEIPNRSSITKKIRIAFKTSHEPKKAMKNMPLERTHGIEVESVLCDGIGITIWDMAGQTDYHSFHELVMPNLSANGSSSMFLLMCNPMEQSTPSKRRSPSNIKLELEWWLRFIASNTRRSLSYCSHVSIVITHLDSWKDDHAFATRIDAVVVELKSQFQEVLEFDEDKCVFKVDGRDVSHAREVFDFIKSHMKQLLERLPKTIRACEEVQRLVASWNVDKSKPWMLKWEEFCEGLCKEVEGLNDVDHELAKRKKEFVAISLNDGGHIIYNEEEGVVITNPHWFCHHIIGQFLYQCTIVNRDLEMVSANGIISMEHMKHLILKLVEGQGAMKKQFDDILGMMMKLHICYKQDANSIMIPSTLKDNRERLNWPANDESTSFKYVGRRVACKDGVKTMLTPGFFT